MKILFLTSHIGLGHATRDYKIKLALSNSIEKDLEVEWCTAEPAYTYLQAKGEKIIKICRRLFSMSIIAEEYIDKKILYRPWVLREYLHLLERNYEILESNIRWREYDLIIADEFWEIILRNEKKILDKTIFLTDIVFKNYELNIFESLASYILNKYYVTVYPKFMDRFYIGLPWDIPNQKIYFLYGEWMSRWIHKYFKIIGRIPSVPYKYRDMKMVEARKNLGLYEDNIIITTLLGGTKADSDTILRAIERFWKIFNKKYQKTEMIIILGPRTKYENNLENIRVLGFTLDIGLYLTASNIVISRAGRTTVTDLEFLGIPSIITPIKNHFEQKYIAQQETKYFEYIRYINNIENIENLYMQVSDLLNYSRKPAPLKYFMGDMNIADTIAKKYK